MVELYGRAWSRREIAARTGSVSQYAGVRLMTLGDGLERGIRLLEFRTGTGLRFTSLVDRAMDIADFEYRGLAAGWHSPAGFRHPGLTDYEGESRLGWLRSFSGFMVTCGLDHILGGYDAPADNYRYRARGIIPHSVHGRVSAIPARLSGYGERWEGDRCFLWAEGIVQQSTVFGEDLHMRRRIEAEVGTNEVRLTDSVVNHGFYRTPHMLFYHINIGYPVLDEGSRYLAPIRDVLWAAHQGEQYRAQDVGYRVMPPPGESFYEQVWEHELSADADGLVPVAVANDRLGVGIEMVTRKDQLPCAYEWQNFQAGNYVLGIEPSTNHVLGEAAARERGEMIWLDHDEERRYQSVFRILPDRDAISAAEERIKSIAKQPEDPFPTTSGAFPSLRNGRGIS